MKKSTLKEKKYNWFAYAIILLPFFYQYKGVGNVVSLGEILVAVTTIFVFCQDGFKLKNVNIYLALFYTISMISIILCMWFGYFDFSAAMTTGVRMLFYALVVVVAREHFDIETIGTVYTCLVFGFSIYLLIQYAFHIATGQYLPIYISSGLQFPPEARPSDLTIYYRWNYRSSSLFLEPGYFVLYVMPLVSMLFFKCHKTKFELLTLGVTIAAVLFSTASAGIVGLVIVFTVYLFRKVNNHSKYRFFLKIFILGTAIAGLMLFLTLSDAANLTIGRLSNGGSINSRITRGFLIFSDLPFFHQIFGVGLNNLAPYMQKYGIRTLFDEGNLNYMASFVQILVFTGIIGWTSLVVFIGNLILKVRRVTMNNSLGAHLYGSSALWTMLFLFIFIICYEAVMYTYRFAFYFVLLEALIKQYREEKRKKITPYENFDDRHST